MVFSLKIIIVNLNGRELSLLIENEELRKSFSDNALLDIDKFSRSRIIKQWLKFNRDFIE